MNMRALIVGYGRAGRTHEQFYKDNGIAWSHVDSQAGFENELNWANEPRVTADHRIQYDIVSICSPDNFHTDQTIIALQHGCHVICEKPLCLYDSELDRLLAAVEKYGRKVWCNLPLRFAEPEIRANVDNERLAQGDARTLWMQGIYSKDLGARLTSGWRTDFGS